ncbi:hypothetical protein [Demequina sp.]|uniref:hypothetical protein n=1 Tax=Demequina sp. TaxID=2050685 RepID=UPI003D10B857
MNPVARIILIVVYSILGLAATGRATVQIMEKFSEAPVAYTVSAISAVLYVVIAVALWRGWERVALVGSSLELAGVLLVGTLGYLDADLWPDETVWTGYGSGYGWVPLLLPLVALYFLLKGRQRRAATNL